MAPFRMDLNLWMKFLISYTLRSVLGTGASFFLVFPALETKGIFIAHKKQMSLVTGAQLATRGRRDMSSRVKDVVLSLALCHNVSVMLSKVQHGVNHFRL